MMNSNSNIPAQNFQAGPKPSTSHSIESIMSGGGAGNMSNRMNYQTPSHFMQQQQQQQQHSSHMGSNYSHMMQPGGMSRYEFVL